MKGGRSCDDLAELALNLLTNFRERCGVWVYVYEHM